MPVPTDLPARIQTIGADDYLFQAATPWVQWFIGFAPVGILLLAFVPYLLYRVYPPTIRKAPEAPMWAAKELDAMGPLSRREVTPGSSQAVLQDAWVSR